MSNVAMSNVAMSNNAMTNDPLRYAVMTNAPLSDPSGGTVPDADPLRSVEVGAVEIAQNPFQSGDLANSNFKETTFAIRNRGNVDTTLAIKMMLRDAICSGDTGNPATSYTCRPPEDADHQPLYKLQLVLRKVSMLPVAIPPTGPAVSTGRAIRIGLTQSNVEVSNVSDPAAGRPDRSELREVPPGRSEGRDADAGAGRVCVRDDSRDRRRRRARRPTRPICCSGA